MDSDYLALIDEETFVPDYVDEQFDNFYVTVDRKADHSEAVEQESNASLTDTSSLLHTRKGVFSPAQRNKCKPAATVADCSPLSGQVAPVPKNTSITIPVTRKDIMNGFLIKREFLGFRLLKVLDKSSKPLKVKLVNVYPSRQLAEDAILKLVNEEKQVSSQMGDSTNLNPACNSDRSVTRCVLKEDQVQLSSDRSSSNQTVHTKATLERPDVVSTTEENVKLTTAFLGKSGQGLCGNSRLSSIRKIHERRSSVASTSTQASAESLVAISTCSTLATVETRKKDESAVLADIKQYPNRMNRLLNKKRDNMSRETALGEVTPADSGFKRVMDHCHHVSDDGRAIVSVKTCDAAVPSGRKICLKRPVLNKIGSLGNELKRPKLLSAERGSSADANLPNAESKPSTSVEASTVSLQEQGEGAERRDDSGNWPAAEAVKNNDSSHWSTAEETNRGDTGEWPPAETESCDYSNSWPEVIATSHDYDGKQFVSVNSDTESLASNVSVDKHEDGTSASIVRLRKAENTNQKRAHRLELLSKLGVKSTFNNQEQSSRPEDDDSPSSVEAAQTFTRWMQLPNGDFTRKFHQIRLKEAVVAAVESSESGRNAANIGTCMRSLSNSSILQIEQKKLSTGSSVAQSERQMSARPSSVPTEKQEMSAGSSAQTGRQQVSAGSSSEQTERQGVSVGSSSMRTKKQPYLCVENMLQNYVLKSSASVQDAIRQKKLDSIKVWRHEMRTHTYYSLIICSCCFVCKPNNFSMLLRKHIPIIRFIPIIGL